jgi:hypothetical protein
MITGVLTAEPGSVARPTSRGEDAHQVDMQPADQERTDRPVGLETGLHAPMLTFPSRLVNKL